MWYFLWTNKIFVLTFIRLDFFHVAKLPNLFCMHQIIIRVWYELVSLWYEVYVGVSVSIFLNNPNIIMSYFNLLLVQLFDFLPKGECVSKPCLCSCILRCKVVATPIQVQSSSNRELEVYCLCNVITIVVFPTSYLKLTSSYQRRF